MIENTFVSQLPETSQRPTMLTSTTTQAVRGLRSAARSVLWAGLLLCAAPGWANANPSEPEVVNINRADAQTLAEVLDGVGLSRAKAIVAYRDTHGQFRDAYELANIKGIGERTVELNEAKIRLQD